MRISTVNLIWLIAVILFLTLMIVFYSVNNQPYRQERIRTLFPELKKTSNIIMEFDSRPSAEYRKNGPESWTVVWNGEMCPGRSIRLNTLIINLGRVNRNHPVSSGKEVFPYYGITPESGTPFQIRDSKGKTLASGIIGLAHDKSRLYVMRNGSDNIYLLDWDSDIPLTPYELAEMRLFPEFDTRQDNKPRPKLLRIISGSANPDLSYVLGYENNQWSFLSRGDLSDQEKTGKMASALLGIQGIGFAPIPVSAGNRDIPLVIQWELSDGRTLTAKGLGPADKDSYLFQREDQPWCLVIPIEALIECLKPGSELKNTDSKTE